MDGPGHQLLARPALALDDDGDILAGHAPDRLVDLLHGRRASHHRPVVVLPEFFGHLANTPFEVPNPPDTVHQAVHLLDIEGLGHVVVGPVLHRGDGVLHGCLGGDDDDEDVGAGGLHGLHDFEAAWARHADVEEDNGEGLGFEELEGLIAVGRRCHSIALVLQAPLEHPADGFLIINNEDAAVGWVRHGVSLICVGGSTGR